jgi:hypothetical protein
LLFDENCGCLSIFGTFKLFFRWELWVSK